MRSLVLVLALAAPFSAFAAAPRDFSIPVAHTVSVEKPQYVTLTFRNPSGQHRALQIGQSTFAVPTEGTLSLSMPVGSVVRVASDQNSKIAGVLVRASAGLGNKPISVN